MNRKRTIKTETWPDVIEDGPIISYTEITCGDRRRNQCKRLDWYHYRCGLFDALVDFDGAPMRLAGCIAGDVTSYHYKPTDSSCE